MAKRTTEQKYLTPFFARKADEVSGDGFSAVMDALNTHKSSGDHDDRYPLKTLTLTAGAGLTGGGTLGANRTFNIGAGNGITVNADSVELKVKALGGLGADADGAFVDKSQAFSWSGTHHFGEVTYLDNVTNARSILPQLTDTYDLGSSTLMWRKGWLSEMNSIRFNINTIQVFDGWSMVPKTAGVLDRDLSADGADVQVLDLGTPTAIGEYILMRNIDGNYNPKVEYMIVNAVSSGNVRYVSRDVDGSGKNNWSQGQPFVLLGQAPNVNAGTLPSAITASQTQIDFGAAVAIGEYAIFLQHNLPTGSGYEIVKILSLASGTTYTVARAQTNSVAQAFTAARYYVKAGYGDGRIELYSLGGQPRISILSQGPRYGAQLEHVRLGYLDLWQGSAFTGIGAAIGDFGAGKYLRYTANDSTLEVKGTIKADDGYLGNLSVDGVLTLATTGRLQQGTGTWGSNFTGSAIWNESGAMNIGGWNAGVKQWWGGSDGKLYAAGGKTYLYSGGLYLDSDDNYSTMQSVNLISSANGLVFGGLFGLAASTYYLTRLFGEIGFTQKDSIVELMANGYAVAALSISSKGTYIDTRMDVSAMKSYFMGAIYATDSVKAARYYTDLPANILDDTAISFIPSSATGVIVISARNANYAEAFSQCSYRVGPGPFIKSMGSGTLVAFSLVALSGTTGADGKMTISACADGKIYIENRTGNTISISYTLLCA